MVNNCVRAAALATIKILYERSNKYLTSEFKPAASFSPLARLLLPSRGTLHEEPIILAARN